MADKEWSDELKAEVVEAYSAQNPTSENTMEIVKGLATDFDKTANGVRMILTKAGVYVKKTAPVSGAAATGDKPARVNKAEAIASLKAAIAELGQNVDDDICDRLTGKAAVYFTAVINAGTDG